jgi:TetR/AcrR family transcriptional repressor of nem operon
VIVLRGSKPTRALAANFARRSGLFQTAGRGLNISRFYGYCASSRRPRDILLSTGRDIFGRRGYSTVGLTDIVSAAGLPKGSFYHYFRSKDDFCQSVLTSYFTDYIRNIDRIFSQTETSSAEKLMLYFTNWRNNEENNAGCLAIKLGAEVADLSDPMRLVLKIGTSHILGRLKAVIDQGITDGSIDLKDRADDIATTLYHQWLGATLMAKILRDPEPFDIVWQALISSIRPSWAGKSNENLGKADD